MGELTIPRFENQLELFLWMVALIVSLVLRLYAGRCATKKAVEAEGEVVDLLIENARQAARIHRLELEIAELGNDLRRAWDDVEYHIQKDE